MIVRDGDWRLFDYDVKSGRQVWIITNPDGSVTTRTAYPVEPTKTIMDSTAGSHPPGDG